METQSDAILNAPRPTARPTPPPPVRQAQRERPRQETRRETRREQPQRQQRRPAASEASAASQGQRNREASQGSRASSVSPARWQSQVQARLNRFKRTPPGGGRGTVSIAFSMDGGGRLTGARVSRSAGNPVLDQAALQLVRRASPFPAPPGGNPVSLTVPIRFD